MTSNTIVFMSAGIIKAITIYVVEDPPLVSHKLTDRIPIPYYVRGHGNMHMEPMYGYGEIYVPVGYKVYINKQLIKGETNPINNNAMIKYLNVKGYIIISPIFLYQ